MKGRVGFILSVCEVKVSALSPETVLQKNLPVTELKNERKENGAREPVSSNIEIRSNKMNATTKSQ